MEPNRAKAKSICVQRMKEWDKSGQNAKNYEDLFNQMSNHDFDIFMQKMITGENPLSGVIPNFSDVAVTVENNVKMAASMGYEMYKRIWIYDPMTGRRYLSPLKHLVYETNVCRQCQSLDHKISTATDNSQIDERTGQPTGNSRAAQTSGPEMMMLRSRGLNKTIIELMKFRGGDNVSMRYIDNAIIKTGTGSMATVPGQAERMPKSVQTMSALLNGMLFENNFAG